MSNRSGGREFINSFLRTISSLYPDEIQSILEDWGKPGSASETVSRWPTDSLSDVRPVSCHSHNDYWRKVPLYSAIQAGCTSVEADIWLFGQDLYVGHSVPALTIERTLNSLYLGGLLQLLDRQNIKPQLEFSDQQSLAGIFDTSPSQSLTLLVDFKTDGHTAWPLLDSQLAPLRDKGYLTHFDGTNLVHRPLTVVGSGNAPFDLITANETYRDIFYDAPLNELGDESATWENPNRVEEIEESNRNAVAFTDGVPGLRAYEGIEPKAVKSMAGRVDRDTYNASNSYYASVSFTASIGHVWGSRLSQRQLRLIRAQVRGAHERGLKVRYWDVPYWPAGLRNHIWHILIREGVDLISVDDLSSATRRDWRKSRRWLY